MPRQFITRTQIDDLAERGETLLEVDGRTTVTDAARERALERGVRVVTRPDAAGTGATPGPTAGSPAPDRTTEVEHERLRAAVRSAVLGALGETPPGLDAVLDRVLRERERRAP